MLVLENGIGVILIAAIAMIIIMIKQKPIRITIIIN